ncbi:AAA family ATPase [Solirubrobacter ginsenosidimutans]|uniref:AAA family ATPase n=1 Tax=Solirubrobacter ginsenosidimutans TaxID=490573 RepID=A0A9X3MQS1_9ACTN|nr:helix-turn-helix transcriptional regulator [Solirubrobacter ginsenosidimutans]MDA0160794.1 AAA family ATPase [Solirubrobacter ginsenosidimutans]
MLHGRRTELERLQRQLEQMRRGQSAVLVLRGEAGIGKTSLLEYVAEQAFGCRVARVASAQSEMELAFAGLHQLCAPMLDDVARLPRPQQHALRVAFGLQDGEAPDRFLVGLAVLNLLAEVAETQPLVCLIDDVQWIDEVSAQLLQFVARRLLAEPIAMVFASREPSGGAELAGLPELIIDGLADDDARQLLDVAMPGLIDERVRERIVGEACGNPLAILELPRGLTPAELAGGFGIRDSRPLADRIERSFHRRFEALPSDSRLFLLAAAAEPVGDVALVRRAAQHLEIGVEAYAPAESAGLIEVGARVRFRHPLVRSAVYWSASPSERRDVHRALASATDAAADPDRRAWHRAYAASGFDEAVAEELERSAARALRRGGAAAAAAFLDRATELTPDPGRRGARALAAAEAKLDAAAPEAAQALLATAAHSPLNDLQRAQEQRLRAQTAFMLARDSAAPSLLLAAAKRLAALDPELALETCLEALAATTFAGSPGDRRDVLEVTAAARDARAASGPPGALDLLLAGLATRYTEGFAASAPALRAALQAFRADQADTNRWLWVACRVAADLWDHESWHELSERGLRLARDTGALSTLPLLASYRAGASMHAGAFSAAAVLMDESDAITQVAGIAEMIHAQPLLAAWRGSEVEALALIEDARRHASARGPGMAQSMIDGAAAVLLNGLGRYTKALEAAQRACAHHELGLYGQALAELVEAAVRADQPALGVPALDRLAIRARASGGDWALGLEARSRALLSSGPSAEALYEEAIERLSGGNVAPHLARARLVYGEWLRREHRRVDARAQLRAAHELFSDMGAEAFAERTRRELSATGESVRRRSAATLDELTSQEAQIAQMARDGQTNTEIAAQLFISPRTVEYHLRKLFPKLGISSRKQLRDVFAPC